MSKITSIKHPFINTIQRILYLAPAVLFKNRYWLKNYIIFRIVYTKPITKNNEIYMTIDEVTTKNISNSTVHFTSDDQTHKTKNKYQTCDSQNKK